jgi:hypothetical protein
LFLLDTSSGFILPINRDTIHRACDIVFNPTMSELVREDAKATTSLQDALRHQVVVISQQVHVCLQVLDYLMDLYNKSRVSSTSSDAKATV